MEYQVGTLVVKVYVTGMEQESENCIPSSRYLSPKIFPTFGRISNENYVAETVGLPDQSFDFALTLIRGDKW